MKAEQGCRAGRKPPIDQRMKDKDQARRELRGRQMQGATNWPSAA